MAKKPSPRKRPPAKPAATRTGAAERGATVRRLDALHRQVREILATARERSWQAINTVMVDAYWEVGRAIVEDEQAGKQRAGYGKRLLEGLAGRLQAESGKGYDPSNLRNMRAANRQRIANSGGSFFRHRITPLNVSRNRQIQAWFV